MYYVFLLRVIKLLACLHACLLWLTHSLVLYMPSGPKKPLHIRDLAPSRRILNPESEKIVLAESGIFRGFGIRNAAQGIQSPTNDWNPEPNFQWQRVESSTWNPESTAWNPESKTVLDSLTWGEIDLHPPLFWAPFTVTEQTMPTSPNDSSSSSPPLITNLCCPFRAALAPSSRHVHSIVIAYRWSSVTHCTSLGSFSECIRRQKSCLVFWNTPLLPSHKH